MTKIFVGRKRLSKILWIIMVAMIVFSIVAAVVGVNVLANNPEMVGEFFGRISKGFIEASK